MLGGAGATLDAQFLRGDGGHGLLGGAGLGDGVVGVDEGGDIEVAQLVDVGAGGGGRDLVDQVLVVDGGDDAAVRDVVGVAAAVFGELDLLVPVGDVVLDGLG